MHAVRLPQFGIENLTIEELPDPVASAGEVLIASEAATINPADVGVVTGAMAASFPPTFAPPYTPGWDVAGRIIAVGSGVDSSLIGSHVVGFSPWFAEAHGMQASLVALPLSNIAVVAGVLPSAQLTTVGLNGLTAWRAVDELDPRPDESVVVVGAAGSVGGFAVELMAARGVRVIAAVSTRDREWALGLGATAVAAREDGELADVVRGIVPGGADGLIDTASLAQGAIGAVRDDGRYVTTTVAPAVERGIRVANVYSRPDAGALATLVEMASSGALHLPVAQEFGVERVIDAYREFTSGPHRGRIVLTF